MNVHAGNGGQTCSNKTGRPGEDLADPDRTPLPQRVYCCGFVLAGSGIGRKGDAPENQVGGAGDYGGHRPSPAIARVQVRYTIHYGATRTVHGRLSHHVRGFVARSEVHPTR